MRLDSLQTRFYHSNAAIMGLVCPLIDGNGWGITVHCFVELTTLAVDLYSHLHTWDPSDHFHH